MMIVSTYFKEDSSGPRAEVHKDGSGYAIHYYDASGERLKTESHAGKSVHWVESAAENWALGIKTLNG